MTSELGKQEPQLALKQIEDLALGLGEGGEDLLQEFFARDTLGRVYEYFLGQFASAEGKKGGEFYTPRCIVKLLGEILRPYKGRVYDPCCGSSGMFVQGKKFIRAHHGRIGDISIYRQEPNYTTWRLVKMNLFPDLKADYILANPPFNMKNWGGEQLRGDKRWRYDVPPVNNANFAWVQHIIHHLAPTGLDGFVLANGSISSNQSGEGEIRKNIIEEDLMSCIVALPDNLFYSTQILACLWFLARDKNPVVGAGLVPAHGAGATASSWATTRVWATTSGVTTRVAPTEYCEIPGSCRSVAIEEIHRHGYVLTPGRYVGAPEQEDDDEPFDQKMQRLVAQLREQQAEALRLDEAIWTNLKELGYDG